MIACGIKVDKWRPAVLLAHTSNADRWHPKVRRSRMRTIWIVD